MTKITKKLLEKELKRYKIIQEQTDNSYRRGQTTVIRRLLKIIDEGYKEKKERVCPFRTIHAESWKHNFILCIEEDCQMWDKKRKDCGLKRLKKKYMGVKKNEEPRI